MVRITEMDFLFVSNADLQFPSLNQYFRGTPPTFADPISLLDFLDLQILVFNLEFHTSSNIFSSLYSDLQVINSGSTSGASDNSFYVNPVTNQLVSDFSVIMDTFTLTKSSLNISTTNFDTADGESKQLVVITIPFSILSVRISHQLPHFRVVDVQVIPNQEVRSFDAKLELYFKNVETSSIIFPST